MAELIVGLGHQSSVVKVVELAHDSIKQKQGFPKRLILKGEQFDIEARRLDFGGAFLEYRVTAGIEAANLDKLKGKINGLENVALEELEGARIALRLGSVEAGGLDGAATLAEHLGDFVPMPETWRVRGEEFRSDRISTELLFQAMIQYKASDVHLCPGEKPIFRVDNETRHSELMPELSAAQLLRLLQEISPERDWEYWEANKQSSFNFHQAGLGYSRVSAFMKAGVPHVTFRFLPEQIPSFEELHVPADTMQRLANMHRGLLLVTGMTGSGKSTTAAAIVDWINTHKNLHILTIENPIEYVHKNKMSMVSQRNLGTDVADFAIAVEGALRHDPDVIVIGEMRDPDTIRSAINAAATGHLVISTLHANTASEVVNRIISFFDPIERDLVRLQLRDCLQCVICQRLVPRKGGGRIPALEMMFRDIKPISDGIMEGDTDHIRVGMQQTVSTSFIFETYLHRLFKKGEITLEHAQEYSTDQSTFDQMHLGTYMVPKLDSLKAAR